MTIEYREAFTEVNDILNNLSEDVIKKIPKTFINNIKENMSATYISKYDKTKGLNEQNLKQETRAILSVIYRDFICDEEMKKKIIQRDRKEWFEQEKNKKYGNIEIFKKQDNSSKDSKENKALPIIRKQNIIIKIIEKIKNIWGEIRGKN